MAFLHDLALDVGCDLGLRVAPAGQPVVQHLVAAPEQHDHIKKPLREEIAGMKIHEYSSARKRILLIQEVNDHILVVFGDVELGVDCGVEVVLGHQLADVQVGELEVLEGFV